MSKFAFSNFCWKCLKNSNPKRLLRSKRKTMKRVKKETPVEITETLAPVVIWSKEYRQDSGGAGEYRGGLGQVMEIGSAEDLPLADNSVDAYVTAFAMRNAADVRALSLVEVLFGWFISRRVFKEKVAGMELAGMGVLLVGLVVLL
mgnify:CR=1 FL=1